jgi:hypothetical protein
MKMQVPMSVTLFCVTCVSLMSLSSRSDAVHQGSLASLWSQAIPERTVQIMLSDNTEPIKSPLDDDSIMQGACRHCSMTVRFKASDTGRKCAACPCGTSNFDCIITEHAGSQAQTWQRLLCALPRGTALQVTFADDNKPEKGIRSIVVDSHTALMPVDGMDSLSDADLGRIAQKVRGQAPHLLANGRQFMISLRDTLTPEHERSLEKAITDAGGHIRWPE